MSPSAFQRDRDRIVHSKASAAEAQDASVLRHAGDHTGHASNTHSKSLNIRTIAKVLQLHEELTEAIALGTTRGTRRWTCRRTGRLDDLFRAGSTTISRACGSSRSRERP